MKYCLCSPCDQTMVMYTEQDAGFGNHWTTKHSEAKLFDSIAGACFQKQKHDEAIAYYWPDGSPRTREQRERLFAWIEEISDEAEFRARPDTWDMG